MFSEIKPDDETKLKLLEDIAAKQEQLLSLINEKTKVSKKVKHADPPKEESKKAKKFSLTKFIVKLGLVCYIGYQVYNQFIR